MNFFIRRDRRRGPEGEELPPRPLTRVEKLRAQVFLGETFKIKSNFLFVPPRPTDVNWKFFLQICYFGLRNTSIQFVLCHFFTFSLCGLISSSLAKFLLLLIQKTSLLQYIVHQGVQRSSSEQSVAQVG